MNSQTYRAVAPLFEELVDRYIEDAAKAAKTSSERLELHSAFTSERDSLFRQYGTSLDEFEREISRRLLNSRNL